MNDTPDDPKTDENQLLAVQLQHKLEFYALGLTFTILALSIQTAKFARDTAAANGLELCSWLLLLVSGLVGLVRLEAMPRSYTMYSAINQYQKNLIAARKAQRNNQHIVTEDYDEYYTVEGYLRATEAIRNVAKRDFDVEKRRLVTRYEWQRWTFGIGVTLLVVARAYEPVKVLVSQVLAAT